MAIGDQVGKQAVEEFNKATVPALDKIIDGLVADLGNQLHALLDRLSGAEITVTIKLPERKL